MLWIALLLCAFEDIASASEPRGVPRVHVKNWGDVIGTYETLWYRNRSVEVFRGIPFAEPPVHTRRFMYTVPLRKAPYSPYHATSYPPACIQIYNNITQSEDCLYLNIWRPCQRRRTGQRLPVVVMIYGGAFIVGHSQNVNYNGLPLSALHDLIVVNFNYRLGAFGFVDMSEVIPEISGNQGWHDQRLALMWVKRHIADFGGDPRRITVMGCSAGAISMSYHLTSPLSNRLFSRVIMDAGVLSTRRLDTNRNSLRRMLRLAVKLGCTSGNSSELLNCLRSVEPTRLRDTSLAVMDSPLLSFRPTSIVDVEAAPRDVAVLMGHSGDEGMSLVSNGFGINDPLPILRNTDEAVNWLKILMLATMPHAHDKINSVWPSLKHHLTNTYFKDIVSEAVLVERAALFVADIFFHCNMLDFYSRLSNITFYVFNREFRQNIEWDVNPKVYHSFHMTAHMHLMGAQLLTLAERIHPADLSFTLTAMRWVARFAWFGLVDDLPRVHFPEVVSVSEESVRLIQSHHAMERCLRLSSLLGLLQ